MSLVTSEYQLEELRNVLGRERLRPYIRPEEAQDLIDNLETIGSSITELADAAAAYQRAWISSPKTSSGGAPALSRRVAWNSKVMSGASSSGANRQPSV